ncbi:MAG: hypothetical protein KF795_08250 [Labilithrix sp.]|nr:hypothetical protein [Labilithrix sp.]
MSVPKSSRRFLRAGIQLGLLGGLVAVVACTERRTDLGGDPASPPAFIEPDADLIPDAGIELRSYCPSDRCPPGHTTCPNSQFLCDTDLLSDPFNCGECGNACRSSTTGANEDYSCIDGRCVLTCNEQRALDCDGIPDNGCEAAPNDNDNCGYCGNKCAADKPCINRGLADLGCGCRPGELYCSSQFFLPCVDPENNDAHCGGCDNACPREGDGTEVAPPNTYFGCAEGQCGTLKCNGLWADCDAVRANGCEQALLDDNNCATCGNKCPDGQRCALNAILMPECMCPAGQTFCGSCNGGVCQGSCADLVNDDANCGACGARCELNVAQAHEACVYGKCERTCANGWGDCNGNRDDGCETHVAADPKNCGGCGIVCDGIAGQACVDGQCMVEPCEVLQQDAGDPAR